MASIKVQYGDTLTGIARANNTTVAALMAANPSIKDPNKIQAGASLNLVSTAAPTTPTPQPKAPTIAEKASLIPTMQKEDPAVTKYYEDQKKAMTTDVDDKAIRESIRQQYNTQFDSLRIAAAQKIAEERKLGEGRLGSARAIQSRSGTLGSNFAGAENDQINRDTEDIVSLKNAEVEAKIAVLTGQSKKDYSDQYAQAAAAKKAGADAYLEYLKTRDSIKVTKATALAKMFAAQGIDPASLSKEDIARLEETYGMDLGSFKGLITEEKNKINKDAFFELTDGESKYKYDPITGKAVLVAENTKNFAPKSGGGTGSGSGFSGTGGGGKYGTDLEALIGNVGASLNGKYKQEAFAKSIKNARNDQDKIAAIATAVNITGDARQDLTQTAVGQNNLRQAITMLKSGTQTGVLKSGANYAFNLVGGQIDPQMTKLNQYITAAIQPYRSSVTGAAWGSQEEAEYKAMFGSSKDTPETLLTKLENLDKIMTNKRVGIVSSYADPLGMNSSFGSYYQNEGGSPTGAPAVVDPQVNIKSKTGQIISIPQKNLSKALEAGYVQVR